jgi:2-oxoisovalerate dehydrogenase E1 component
MRTGKGPAIIEADVYRFFHHGGGLLGSAFGYRTKEEEASWRARDPLARWPAK